MIDVENGYPMGITAENVAELDQISRQAQDEFALRSHQKAVAAQKDHAFDREIVPVEVQTRKGTMIVKDDEAPRADTSIEALQKLKPSFASEGTVTAGNASGLNDGAAAVMLASESAVKEYGLQPLAEWQATTLVGIDPAYMGLGPAYAIENCSTRRGSVVRMLICMKSTKPLPHNRLPACADSSWMNGASTRVAVHWRWVIRWAARERGSW